LNQTEANSRRTPVVVITALVAVIYSVKSQPPEIYQEET